MFSQQHVWLLVCWLCYCILHSVLAAGKWKQLVQKRTGSFFRYYRIVYSLFAMISLFALLLYHFSFPYDAVLLKGKIFSISGLLIAIAGSLIMIICIHKYFFDLSGVDVFFYHSQRKAKLEQNGLHRYSRHPLYFGTLLFTWGLFFLMPYLQHLIACFVMTTYLLVAIEWEEKKLVNEFGPHYIKYAQKVPKLIPGFKKLKIKN